MPTRNCCGPRKDCCLGLHRSEHSWQVAVTQEWVRQGAWAKDYFRRAQLAYEVEHHALKGGCPAVLTLGQLAHHRWCPHRLRAL